jgi:hypothetical protein
MFIINPSNPKKIWTRLSERKSTKIGKSCLIVNLRSYFARELGKLL